MKINWWRTSFGTGEVNAIVDAISQERIGMGPITEKLEKKIAELLDVPYVVVTPSGSVALFMALLANDIGVDDEVIIPNRTFIATAHAALLTKAKVVLVDTCPDKPIIDVSQITKKITSKTKAIMPVHLNGRAANMEEINTIASKNGLKVIEDACQAFFSKKGNQYLGTISDTGCFSLGLAKLITTGYGGFAVCKEKQLYEKLIKLRNHGILNSEQTEYNDLGFNFKYSDMISAIGIVQVSRAKEKIDHLITIYNLYKSAIENLPFLEMIPVNHTEGEVPLYIEVRSTERKKVLNHLEKHNIDYHLLPPNLNLSQHLNNEGDFPNSKKFDEQAFILPCGPSQPISNVEYVIEALNNLNYT